MKRLTRDEFLKQPSGVFYFKESERALCIKHDRAGGVDWYVLQLAAIEPPDADGRDWANAVYEAEKAMLEQKISLPLCDTVTRDGLFDKDETFFVLDVEDLETLQQRIAAAIRVVTKPTG